MMLNKGNLSDGGKLTWDYKHRGRLGTSIDIVQAPAPVKIQYSEFSCAVYFSYQ